MPSNGAEGEYFHSIWCANCVKATSCQIDLKAMCGEQPKQWRYDDDGVPECTSFSDERKPRKYRCKQTNDLFG